MGTALSRRPPAETRAALQESPDTGQCRPRQILPIRTDVVPAAAGSVRCYIPSHVFGSVGSEGRGRRPSAAVAAALQTPLCRHFYRHVCFFFTRPTFRRLTERLRRLTADPTRGLGRSRSVAPLSDEGTGLRPPAEGWGGGSPSPVPGAPGASQRVPRGRRRRRGGAARDGATRQVSDGRRRTPGR